MNKKIVEKIQEQFDCYPKKIHSYILKHFDEYPSTYKMINNVYKPLGKFVMKIEERWIKAEKDLDLDCIYALPKKLFKQIEKLNQEDFINVWNEVLEFIWKQRIGSAKNDKYLNHLYLLVRIYLMEDYGYFDTIDTNKLFRINNE